MPTAIYRKSLVLLTGVALAGGALGCSSHVREGRSPSYLIVDSVLAASGTDQTFGNTLSSDVETKSAVYSDSGQATMTLALKDIGPAANPAAPTTNNFVTVTRYHVQYRRSDGRNTQGVDVPYEWDAAATVTVSPSGSATIGFELVRLVAKEESPLVQLKTSPSFINTITEVTFFGRDTVGNDVSATGKIQINFGNFGDS